MADTLSKTIYRQLFSDAEWVMIYNFVGHALDDDEYDPEDVYAIRNKIHAIFDEEWHLTLTTSLVMLLPSLVWLVFFQRASLFLLLFVVTLILL